MKRSLPAVELFAALVSFAAMLPAHGGQYRGPSAVVPPSGGSSSSGNQYRGAGDVVPGSSGTGTSSGSTSSKPAVTTPNAPATSSSRGPRGAQLEDDLGRWEFWWEFGKDPYLRLRDALYGAGPGALAADDALLGRRLPFRQRNSQPPATEDLVRIADALVTALHKAHDRDTISACMVALAKIGRDGDNWKLHDVLAPYLRNGDQEMRETAALALGIAGLNHPQSVELLRELVADGPEARKASGGNAINERTRAFAAFGLGLLLQRLQESGQAHQILSTLRSVLTEPEQHGRELKVAAIEAMSLLAPGWRAPAAQAMRSSIVGDLAAYYARDLGTGEQLIQAHVPPAIARLLGPADPLSATYRERFAEELEQGLATEGQARRGSKSNIHVPQSLAIALGELGLPWDQPRGDQARIGELLLRTYRDHRDEQTRSFALLAIARCGGSQAKVVLLRELAAAGRAIEQPWCAVALGVLHARNGELARANGSSADLDSELTDALLATFRAARNPASQSALAVALGLNGDPAAGDELRRALQENRQRDDAAGYIALALGLLRDPRAIGDLRQLRGESTRRPFLLMQCVRGLGLLGDGAVVDDLCAELGQPEPSLVRLSAAASALGQIGDRRSLEPLLKMLTDSKLTPLTRAFAAVALGGICDKDPLPWNTTYATQTNYRAATATLTDGQSGILDIL